jgi:hypothetical protein
MTNPPERLNPAPSEKEEEEEEPPPMALDLRKSKRLILKLPSFSRSKRRAVQVACGRAKFATGFSRWVKGQAQGLEPGGFNLWVKLDSRICTAPPKW